MDPRQPYRVLLLSLAVVGLGASIAQGQPRGSEAQKGRPISPHRPGQAKRKITKAKLPAPQAAHVKASAERRTAAQFKAALSSDHRKVSLLCQDLQPKLRQLNQLLGRDADHTRLVAKQRSVQVAYLRSLKAINAQNVSAKRRADKGRLANLAASSSRLKKDYIKQVRGLAARGDLIVSRLARQAGLDKATMQGAFVRRFGTNSGFRLNGLAWECEPSEGGEETPTPQQPFKLTAPYATGMEGQEGSLLGTGIANFNTDSGSTDCRSETSLAGGSVYWAAVGDFIQVPAGFRRMRITATYKDIDAETAAIGLAGGAWSEASVLISVEGPDGGSMQSEAIAGSMAVVAWITDSAFQGDKIFSWTLHVPEDGGRFLVQAGVSVTSGAVANGHCFADCFEATVEEICVELLP